MNNVDPKETIESSCAIPVIDTNHEYIKWWVRLENEMKHENLINYTEYFHQLLNQTRQCTDLFGDVSTIIII